MGKPGEESRTGWGGGGKRDGREKGVKGPKKKGKKKKI